MPSYELTRSEFARVKATTKLSVEAAGGQECCASFSGRIRRPASFSEYGNGAQPDRVIPLDVAIEQDRFTGDGRLTKLMAELTGYLAVPMPDPNSGLPILNLTGKSATEVGALVSEMIGIMADHKVTPDEATQVLPKIYSVMSLMASLAEQVKAVVEDEE